MLNNIFCLLCFLFLVCAVQAQVKKKHIIVLDITKSMEGYQGKTPDIWSSVINYMQSFVEKNVKDGEELILYTYGTNITKVFWDDASTSSKKEFESILKKLRTEVVYTCTFKALKEVFDKLEDDNTSSHVYLWTDGKNNCPGSNISATEIVNHFNLKRGGDDFWYYNTLGQVEVEEPIKTEAEKADTRVIIQKGDEVIKEDAKKVVQLRPKYTTFVFNEDKLSVDHGGFIFSSGDASDVKNIEIDPASVKFNGLEGRSDVGIDIKVTKVPTKGSFKLELAFADGYMDVLRAQGKDQINGSFSYKSFDTEDMEVKVVPKTVEFRFEIKKKTVVKINFSK